MFESISSCDTCECPLRSEKQPPKFRRNLSELDKENRGVLGRMKSDDISFYGNDASVQETCTGTSPNHCLHRRISRESIDTLDPSSQDSGYGTIYAPGSNRFSSYASPTRSSLLSFGSLSPSMEDEFLEDIADFEPLDENLPLDFKKLISGALSAQNNDKIISKQSPNDVPFRPEFRRALSLQNDSTTPNSSRVRSCLFGGTEPRPFKRPEPPTDADSPLFLIKRTKTVCDDVFQMKRPVLQRPMSVTEESIKFALQRSSEEELIGDFSRSYSLPLVQGRHRDLKSITPGTLAKLMKGGFEDQISSYKVIDCRYPYEFDGGHIDGALNVYTKEQCLKLLEACIVNQTSGCRQILVFHCEFSSERGPNLFRFLRQQDRTKHEADYPTLQYPEIYLLEGGYKNFYGQFSSMCVPVAYKEMLHPEHEDDLRFFRQKSKTWNADSRQRPTPKSKRL